MSNDRVFTMEELSEFVEPLLRKYDLRSARVFGSYARGEASPTSDIDIIIDGGPHFRALNVYALAEDLREVSGKEVDAFEISELGSGDFRDAVLREAVTL